MGRADMLHLWVNGKRKDKTNRDPNWCRKIVDGDEGLRPKVTSVPILGHMLGAYWNIQFSGSEFYA